MIRTAVALSVLLGAFPSGACARNQTASANTPPEASVAVTQSHRIGPGVMGVGDPCPMLISGTTVQTMDTSDGVAMTFTTTGDVGELRRRVYAMADQMNGHSRGGMGMHGMMMGSTDSGPGMMMGGGMGPGMHPGMMGWADAGAGSTMGGGMMMGGMMVGVRAQAKDVEGGAGLRVTPGDQSRLGQVRQHMQQQAQMMNQEHGCPMTDPAARTP